MNVTRMADRREPEAALGPGDPSSDPSDSRLGPAPVVAGADRLRASLRARMFGDDEAAGPARDAGAEDDAATEDVAAGDERDDDGFGPAPAVAGSDRMRADLRARLFGDDAAAEEGESEDDEGFGPAPAVAGSDRMRADLRARLFGDDGDAAPGEEESAQIGVLKTQLSQAKTARLGASEPELAGSIGRFRVLDRLGSGGMGVVYSAYDPELDRKVAIKLLRPDVRQGMEARDEQMRALGDESEARTLRDAHARLLREAQAMARLSHPNVIVVHEVGTVGDGVFVAMEFIDGMTLGEWIADRSHGWREVLGKFLDAGAGLAAAHRADLVHRDFKPDNVLLGKEGQVRVLDFGLARSMSEPTSELASPRIPLREQPDIDPLGTPLTRTGAVMGTPAYMSPEQYLGHPADARSDQFSFCVALYEGLYGVRPFEGNDLTTLATHVVEGVLRETPSDARVPKRILATLKRGLAPEPADRYPSIEALLADLRRDPARRLRWAAVVLGVGALTSIVTLAATGGDDAADACAGLERRLDGVWDDKARAEVVATIESTELSYAPRVAATTVELLDDYTHAWVNMAADACGAALVAQGDDAEHLRRRQCLDQRLAEVGALVDALREPDSGMAEVAVKATVSLTTGLSACADPRRLAAYDVVDDPQTRQRLAEAHAKLALAKAQGVLGHYERAAQLAGEVVDEAREAGAGPLEALGLLARGTYRERTDDPELSEADLRAAIELADRHGDPGTRAQALIMLVYVVAQDRTRYVEARMLGDQARAVLDYIDADPLLLADLDNNLGVAARVDGDFETALTLHMRSHERRVEVLSEDHPSIGRSLLNIGISMGRIRERQTEAEEYLRRALASLERSQGSEHPVVGNALLNLGNSLGRQGRMDEAIVLQRRALAIYEDALGPQHRITRRARFNLARALQGSGKHEDAAEILRRALTVLETEMPADDVRLKVWVSHLARSELALERFDAAAQLLERSLKLRAADGETALLMSYDRMRLAQALTSIDRARARTLAQQAHDVLTESAKKAGGVDQAPKQVKSWLEISERWLAEHSEG